MKDGFRFVMFILVVLLVGMLFLVGFTADAKGNPHPDVAGYYISPKSGECIFYRSAHVRLVERKTGVELVSCTPSDTGR